MNKYSKKSKIRKNSRKLKRSRRKSTKAKKSRNVLRLIRNKSGGGRGFAPWVGSNIESLNHNSERFRHLDQQYNRNNGCLLMSCHQW